MKKKGLIFDLDGVITDTATYHYKAWKQLAQKINITIDEQFNETLKGISRMESLEKILVHGHRENDFTIEEKTALAAEKNTLYIQQLATLSQKDLLPGIYHLLKEAQTLNLPCSIASASRNAPMILEKLEVTDFFAYVVDPGQLKKGKPDPEIFIKAAEGIHVKPAEAIGFEDAQAGIDGLNKAGIFSIGISQTKALHHANIQVQSLTEIHLATLLS